LLDSVQKGEKHVPLITPFTHAMLRKALAELVSKATSLAFIVIPTCSEKEAREVEAFMQNLGALPMRERITKGHL
jgi:hypothetical protein